MNKTSFLLTGLVLLSAPSIQAEQPVGTIPFRRDGQLMLVDASINGGPAVPLVVDTGAPHTVFDPKFARELGLAVKEAPPTTGTGTGDIRRAHGDPVALTLAGVKIDIPEPWIIDLSKVPIPQPAKGLVGAELFTGYVVRMDPLRSTFSVFRPESYNYNGSGASIPLLVEDGKLFLEAELELPAGHRVTHKLRIDTGSESSVNDEIVKQSSEVRSSTLGHGLGEDFKSYSGVFTAVKIGPYSFSHVWGPAGRPPSIGMELLRRFIITFDARHARMYLEPTPALTEPVPTPPADS